MADILGDLRLLLSAPSDRLLADLAASDRFVADYHSKWEKKFSQISFRGIAGNLNLELTTAEAVLNRSLANMQRQVKNSKLKISIDTSGLDFSDMEARLAKLSQQTVRVEVDLEPLHSLNRLLYLKQKDIGDTQAIANKGINVKVDLSGLEAMGRSIDSVQAKLSRLQDTQLKSGQINIGSSQQISFSTDSLSRDIATAIERGFKTAKPSGLSQAAGKIADTAASPLKAIARGALEGFGKDMTRGLTGGLISSLESAAGSSIGSTNLVGQKIGDQLALGIAGKLGKSLKSELSTQLRDALGGVDIDRDFGAQITQRSKSQSRKTSQAAEGLNQQRRETARESLVLIEEKNATANQIRALGTITTPVAKAAKIQESKLFEAQVNGDQKGIARAQRVLGRARLYISKLELQQAELEIKKVEIETQHEVIRKRSKELDARIEAVSPTISDSYQKLANAAAGKRVGADKLPQIIAAPNILKKTGAQASYGSKANAILVSPELVAQYKSGNVSDRNIEGSIHELTHAADFDFGSVAGVRADKLGKPLRTRTYTAEEIAYAAPTVARYRPEAREAELSAYAAEYSIAHPLIKQRQEERNLQALYEKVGYGGVNRNKIATNNFGKVKAAINLTDIAGVHPAIVSQLTDKAINIKGRSKGVADEIYSAGATGRLADGGMDLIMKKIHDQQAEIDQLLKLTGAAGKDHLQNVAKNPSFDKWGQWNNKSPIGDFYQNTARYTNDKNLNPWDWETPKKERFIATVRKQNTLLRRFKSSDDSSAIAETPYRPVDAEIVQEPFDFRGAFDAAKSKIIKTGQAASNIVRPVVSFGRSAYEFAEGVESAALPYLPGGRAVKAIGKNIVAPALAYSATASIPGVGDLVHGGLGAGVESMLSIGGGAAQAGLTHAITGALADLPMIGPAISSALSTAAGGAIEAGISALAPVLAGQTILQAGKAATNQLAGKSSGKTKRLGAASTTGALNAASSLVSTEISALPGSESTLPALPAGGLARIEAASKRIATAWATIEGHISNGQVKKAKFIAEGLERQTTNLISEAKIIEAEVGKATPAGNKLFSLQGNLGKKRKQAQNALKKIELIEDQDEDIDSEISDLRQKKSTSRKKQFQKFRKSYVSKNNDSYFKNLPFTLPSAPELIYPEIPDPFEPEPSRKRPGAYLRIYSSKKSGISAERTEKTSVPDSALSPVTLAPQPNYSQFEPKQPASATSKAGIIIQRLQARIASFDSIASSIEGTISGKELLNKINSGESLNPATKRTEALTSGLKDLAGAGKLAIGTFAGFQIGQIVATQFGAAIKESVALTGEFEQLQIRLQAATGSIQSGANRFNALRQEAKGLGISQRGALETGARLSATTQGTELEGAPTEQITSQVLGIAKSRGLNSASTNSLSLAISQIVGKRLSTEELNQLIESGGLPDAKTIGARSLGLNPEQFKKQLENGSGIDGKKFISAFLAQANSDSLLIKDASLDTQQSKLGKLQSNYENLQVTIGAGISPAYKAGLDALSGGLELLNKGVEIGSTVLIGFALKSIPAVVGGLYTLGKAAIGATAGMGGLAGGIAVLGGKLAIFYALGESIKFLSENLKDAGEETDKETVKIQTALDNLKGVKVEISLPKDAGDIAGKDWSESAILAIQRKTTPFLNGLFKGIGLGNVQGEDVKVVAERERRDGRTRALEQIPQLQEQVGGAVAAAGQIGKLDLLAQQLASRRSALFLNGADATGIRQLDQESKNLSLQRFNAQKSIAPIQGIVQQKLNQFKGEQDKLGSLAAAGQISESEFANEQQRIKGAIEEITRLQEKLNKAIKSPLDDLAQYNRSLDVLAAKYEGISADVQSIENAQKRVRNADLVTGRASQGQSDYRQSIDEQTALAERIVRTTASIATLKSQLNSIDPQQVNRTLQNYGLNLQTTSVAEFNALSQSVTDPLDKTVLAKLATIKQQSADLDGFKSQLDDSRTSLFKKLRDENKGVTDYYRSISQSFDRDDLKSQSLLNNITAAKNRFQRVLSSFGDSLADGFFGEISNLLESANDEIKAKAEQAKGLRQNTINLQNKLIEIEYKKSTLSGNESPTPTDFSGVSSPIPGQSIEQILAPRKLTVQRPSAQSGSSRSGHTGVDYSGAIGSPVNSILPGEASLETNIPWGNGNRRLSEAAVTVTSKVGDDIVKFRYFHLGKETIRQFQNGQKKQVRAGEQIGVIGADGGAPGTANEPHVDIKVRVNGQKLTDPQAYIASLTKKISGLKSPPAESNFLPLSSRQTSFSSKKEPLGSNWDQKVNLYRKDGSLGTIYDPEHNPVSKKTRFSGSDDQPSNTGIQWKKTPSGDLAIDYAAGIVPDKKNRTRQKTKGAQLSGEGVMVTASTFHPGGGGYEGPELDPLGNRLTAKDLAVAIPGLAYGGKGLPGLPNALPYGSIIEITDPRTGKSINASVRDAGPFAPGRDIDVTTAVKNAIGFNGLGTLQVKLVSLPKGADPNKEYNLGNSRRFTTKPQRNDIVPGKAIKLGSQQHSMEPYGAGFSTAVSGLQLLNKPGSDKLMAGNPVFDAIQNIWDKVNPFYSPEKIKKINEARQSKSQAQPNTFIRTYRSQPAKQPSYLDSVPNTQQGGADIFHNSQKKQPSQIPSDSIDRFLNSPLPTVRKKGKKEATLPNGSNNNSNNSNYNSDSMQSPSTSANDSVSQSQTFNAKGQALLEEAAKLVNDEKRYNDENVNSKYAADSSASKLRQTQSITNISEQQYKTDRSLRERLRQNTRTADGLVNRPTQLEQEGKQNQELDYSIEDSRQAYSDLARELDRSIYKGNAYITDLSSKGKNATLEESHALAKVQETVKLLLADRETLQKDIQLAEANYSAARNALQLSQAIENKDNDTSLNARNSGALIQLKQAFLTRQEEIDKTNAPFQNDSALSSRQEIEVNLEKQSLSQKVIEIQKERRKYQGGDGSTVLNSAELDKLRLPFENNLKKLRTESQLSKQLETFSSERDRLLSIQKNEPTKFGDTAKSALRQYQSAISQISTDRQQRRNLQRQIDNISAIEKLNKLQVSETVISQQKVLSIRDKSTNDLNSRAIERRNYQSETDLTKRSSYLSLDQSAVDRRKNFGLESYNADYDLAVKSQEIDYSRQTRGLQAQKEAITATGDAADKSRANIQLLIDNLAKLNQSKLDGLAEAFNPVNDAIKSVQTEFRSQLGDKLFGNGQFNINKVAIAGLSNIGSKLLDSVTSSLFSGLYQQAPKQVYGPPAPGAKQSGTDWIGTGLGFLGKIFGFAEGGQPEYDMSQSQLERSNTPFGVAMRRERALSGRTPVAIVANTDEMVLNPRQSTAYRNSIINFDRGGNTSGLSIPNLSPVRSLNLDPQKIASSRDININISGDAAAGSDPVAMKQMVGAFRSIVTEELINHKRQRTGLIN